MSEFVFPNFLNEEYFQEILARTHKNSSIKVCDVEVGPCGAANDGFLSTLLRVHVNFIVNSSVERESFVVKMSTTHPIVIEMVGANSYDVQNKEMMFFEVIAPQIEKILKKIGEGKNLIPRAVAVDREHDVIVFEDLQVKNFLMFDRLVGLDEVHTKLALKKLAKFHAASLVMKQKHPQAFKSFDAGMFSRKRTAFNYAFVSIFEFLTEEVGSWPGYENYAKKMKKLQPSLIEAGTRCFDVNEGDFCVLNHGDIWTNNLMFKYDEKDCIDDVILVRYSRAAISSVI